MVTDDTLPNGQPVYRPKGLYPTKPVRDWYMDGWYETWQSGQSHWVALVDDGSEFHATTLQSVIDSARLRLEELYAEPEE